jgi:hypothetical protein
MDPLAGAPMPPSCDGKGGSAVHMPVYGHRQGKDPLAIWCAASRNWIGQTASKVEPVLAALTRGCMAAARPGLARFVLRDPGTISWFYFGRFLRGGALLHPAGAEAINRYPLCQVTNFQPGYLNFEREGVSIVVIERVLSRSRSRSFWSDG